MKVKLSFLMAVFLLQLSGTMKAQLLIEDFNYTQGTLLVDHGWTAHSGAGSSSIDVTSGLSFDGYASSGIGGAANLDSNGEDVHKTFTEQTSGSIYAAFIVKTEATNSAGYFLHLGQSTIGTTFISRVWVNATGSGVGIGSSAPSTYTSITAGTPTLLVVKYDYSSKVSSLFVFNSFPATEPGTANATFTETASISNVGSLGLRQYNNSQRIIVDGIRVATTWAEAVKASGSAGGNLPPTISQITLTPATDITSTTTVAVSADISDADGTITAANLKWGTSTGVYPHTIEMLAGLGNYVTTSSIPAQADGTTVYFVIDATDNEAETTTSSEQSYQVANPPTATLPYIENFDTDLSTTYNYTVSGLKPWYFYNSSAAANGYQGNNPEEHWLVLPSMNLSNYSNETMNFTTYVQYGTIDANNYLKLYYSTNYSGYGNVASATWTELPFTQPVLGASETSAASGGIDLSSIAGANVHLAFKYYASDSPSRYRIDDISITTTGVDDPASFVATAAGTSQINLTFAPNATNNNVAIVYNETGVFTVPSAVVPALGQPFAGGTLLYAGTTSPQSHTGLAANQTVYYKAFSYSGTAYSAGLTANATTDNATVPGALAAGDIALIAYQFDNPDKFAFVAMVDIPAAVEINFTDNAFTNASVLASNENTGTYTSPAGGLAKGAVVQIEGTTVTGGGTMVGGLTGLSNSGDQIIAYQGLSTAPTFIAALSTNTWLTSGATNSNTSYLPTGLTSGLNAIDFPTEVDNGYYNGATTGTKNELQLLIHDPANWTTDNSIQAAWPTWVFTIGAGGNPAPVISNIIHTPNSGITPSTTVNVSADVTDNGTVASVKLLWGLTSGSLTNNISMAINGGGPTYTTITAIPAQADGTTVYYSVSATDNIGAETVSVEASYSVYEPASKLAFVGFPTSGQQGTNLSTFTVEAQRANGSVDGNYSGSITLSKASGSGTLSGTLTKTAVNGVATFNAVQLDQPGSYTLHADATGLTQATSAAVNITDAPELTEILLPKYMQGVNGSNNNRLPFAYRVKIDNLNPNATYRYINQIVTSADGPTTSGAGNVLYVNSDNSFTRTSGPSFTTAGAYGEFTTDANGSFTGWFMNESSGNARFTPGNEVFMRIRLNDGNNGTSNATYLTTTSPVKVINFGNEVDANQGTAIRAESGAQAKNFMFLYDNIAGNGRPIYGTSIETTGIDFSTSTSWAGFYIDNVATENGSWGGIIPNMNAGGVKLLQERKLVDGTVAASHTSVDGVWGVYNTVNPVGGTSNVIFIDLNQAASLTVNPESLSGFSYNQGQGPSATQSFVINASNLISTVTVVSAPDYEISLTNAPNFNGASQLNLAASGGIVNNVTIFVRLKAGLNPGTYNGQTLYVASSSAETKTVMLSGTVVAGIIEPANHVTAFAATALGYSNIQLNWTDAVPAASGYLIKGSSLGFNDIAAPVDGVAEPNGALVRNVVSGVQTYTFDGLNSLSAYYFKIFPYNGTTTEINYKVNGTVPQATATTTAGPVMMEDILPLTLQGSPNRIPYAFRLSFSGLLPTATYKYINQAVSEADGPTASGAGNSIYVSATGVFTRTTGASFTNAAQHAEFTTDASGNFTGWFMLEPTTNARFSPGNTVFMRIRLNNGAGGTTAAHYFTSQGVSVIGFGTEAEASKGTGIRATSAFAAGNFAFLYSDNARIANRPVAGTSVESTAIDFSTVTAYPSFFRDAVAGTNGAWGTIIPNISPSGITKIEERSNATGAIVSTKTSANGIWGTTSTVNPGGGMDNVLVLNLDQNPTITASPTVLNGFSYIFGFGPSAIQNFVVSGSNLSSAISLTAPADFELSLFGGAAFVGNATLTLPQVEGVVAGTTIYVRMKAGRAINSYTGNVQLTSSGAVSKTVALSGQVSAPATEPVNHLTAFTVSANGMTAINTTWVDAVPSANGYLIKGSTLGYNDIAAPFDGVIESEGMLVKYVAAGVQTASFSGLNPETTYYFKAFAYNGSMQSINYKTNGTVPQGSAATLGSPALTNLIVPQFMQGVNGTNNSRVPYAFRIELKNLQPMTTYRYINQAVGSADSETASGAGNPIYVMNNTFVRSTNPSFATAGQYGEFITDANGKYTGWFMIEATGNVRFTPGAQVSMRLRLNNGQGGTTAAHYFTSESVTVLNFGQTLDGVSGTGIRATSSAAPRNFVFLYDNASGAGRPLYGTSVEITGVDFATNTSYPAFYRDEVAGTIGAWGGIVPNNNILGLRRVEERSLTTGVVVSYQNSQDGFWGVTNTVNPTGGLENVIVLNLNASASSDKIAGQLKYFNEAETPMLSPNSQSVFYVQLMENGIAVRPRQLVKYNQEKGLDAYFEFENIESGRSYSLRVWEQTQDNLLGSGWTWNNWGGASAVDALILSFMAAENPIVEGLPWIAPTGVPNYSPHFFAVADMNNSNSLSAVDALVLQNRSINTPGYHPLPGGRHNFQLSGARLTAHAAKQYPQAPPVVFTPYGEYAAQSNSTSVYYEALLPVSEDGLNVFNVYYTAAGDLNASYQIGTTLRSKVGMTTSETLGTSVGQEVKIPVYATHDLNTAAVSLQFTYNTDLFTPTSVEGFELYTIENGRINISWFDQQARVYAAGDPLCYVIGTVNSRLHGAETLLAVGGATEFANANAEIIDGVQLATAALATENLSPETTELQSVVYPNPFGLQAQIQVWLPEAGKSQLLVFNQFGQKIYQTDEATHVEGSFNFNLDRKMFPAAGIYFYKVVHYGSAQSYLSTGRMVISK